MHFIFNIQYIHELINMNVGPFVYNARLSLHFFRKTDKERLKLLDLFSCIIHCENMYYKFFSGMPDYLFCFCAFNIHVKCDVPVILVVSLQSIVFIN